jgi:hypothetical protein
MSDKCPDSNKKGKDKKKSVFYKYESEAYRKTCETCNRGYHGNRWDAHHVLPGTVFGQIADPFIHECLALTEYDINESYSMAGLPKLTAFILYFQRDRTVPFQADKEKTVTMRRWGTVEQYQNQAHLPVVFPGDLPVHNPCNWGHTEYNDEVAEYLEANIWDKLVEKKEAEEHVSTEFIKTELHEAQAIFWSRLESIGKEPGGGGFRGVEANLRNRYDKSRDGWWKPLCMSSRVTSAPMSPGIL